MHDGAESQPLPTWKTYLYTLQQEAPVPRRIICQREVPNRPTYYGKEFHGNISRDEADRLLSEGDGCYLVRKSERAPDAFTLAIRFNGETKNFKLYYEGKHFVGEKRFDTVHDLVADGLIHFYIELRAADYISSLSNESNYEESPYLAYSSKKKRLVKSKSRPLSSRKLDYVDGHVATPVIDIPGTVTDEEEQLDEEEDLPPDWKDYKKCHCFKLQNFMGLHWCDFCANFMWGLIAQGVKCQDCGFEAHKRCSEKVPNDCMPDMRYVKRIFGADLTTVVKAQKTTMPHVVEKCVKEIESRGLDGEGIYRIAGFHDDVEAIRMAFDKDGEHADISVNKYDDVNTITSALKLYFRLLPIPIITFDVYKSLLDAVKTEDIQLNDQVRVMKEAVARLPPAHFQTLKYLIAHLVRVSENKSKNMMGAENLAIVFAPTLMRPMETDPMVSLLAAKFEQKVVEILITNFREIFGR